jgi:hypothetical protein
MDLLAKIELASESGISKDRVTMSFAFQDVPDFNYATVAPEIPFWLFNTTAENALMPLAACISSEIERTGTPHQVKVYDITGKLAGNQDLGSPIDVMSFALGAKDGNAAAVNLPSEVAFCVTLEGEGRAEAPVETDDGADAGTAPDRPRQRRTGRVYIGPLHALACTTVAGQVRPSSVIRDTARLSIMSMANHVFDSSAGGKLSVWSRADAALYEVDALSADDAFDTIRSRGATPTARTRWTDIYS